MADLDVTVIARASADRVGPFADGVLRMRVTRPASDGEANRVVVRLLADALGVPRSRVELIAGGKARRKRIRIHELDPDALDERLRALPAD